MVELVAPDDLVEGAWYRGTDEMYAHGEMLFGYDLKNTNGKAILLAGCVLADAGVSGLKSTFLNPYFHGFYYYNPANERLQSNELTKDMCANYIAGGLYLTYVAREMVRGKEYSTASVYVKCQNGTNVYNLAGMITNDYIDSVEGITWEAQYQR